LYIYSIQDLEIQQTALELYQAKKKIAALSKELEQSKKKERKAEKLLQSSFYFIFYI
jgi:hypothetical protein